MDGLETAPRMAAMRSDRFPALLADIGGTNARFALDPGDGPLHHVATLACDNHHSLAEAARSFLDTVGSETPRYGAFCIAGPVAGDQVGLTNHPWRFSIAELRDRLGLQGLEVVNDFTAVALAVPGLTAADLCPIGGGGTAPDAPAAVLGPGTGLGVAGLLPTAGGPLPVTSEGGHAAIAAWTDREAAVLGRLRRRFNHVSAERVLSGDGLVNLYRALAELDGAAVEDLAPDQVTARALADAAGPESEALDMFCAMLGGFAANVALTFCATGGVYLAGGILPRIVDRLRASDFRTRFEIGGRFSDYLAGIATQLIVHPHPAFVGLHGLLARG
jgi:glucokinase